MSARRKISRIQRAEPPAAASIPRRWVRPWLLLALVALCVARPLLPSEGVSWLGDGQPFNLLWLLLAAGWLLWVAVCGVEIRAWNTVDVAVAVLVALCVVSAIAGSREGSPRYVMNMLWEWVGLGLVFILTRQLVRTAAETRAVVAVMVALAVALAVYGFYQVLVTLPADRAAYAENPDELLRSLGQWLPPDSPERARFESRLASTEPLSTFALTNSLAGFLAPWLIVALGIVVSVAANRQMVLAWAARLLAMAMFILVIAGCFVLTKSRSAYIALAVGIVLMPLCSTSLRWVASLRVVLGAMAALAALVGAAIVTRGLEAPVLTEGFKSFSYRLEYWRSTLAMIRHHFFLGVGPGSFQDYYTQYKLPEASEEIRDPHNFLLEVWATSGSLALVALCVALAALAWREWHAPAEPPDPSGAAGEPNSASRTVNFMMAGGAVGLLLAYLVAPLVGMAFSDLQLVAGLVVGAVVVAVEWPWVARGTLPPRLPALALLVLAIHLLAAGGIAYPGVAYTFWMLAALAVNLTEPQIEPASAAAPGVLVTRERFAVSALFAVTCAAAVTCYYFACGPVVRAQAAMANAQEAQLSNPQPYVVRIFWKDAADADPWSPDPWAALAELELGRLKQVPSDAVALRRFSNAVDQLSQVRSHSSAVMRQIARWFLQLYDYDHDPERLKSAIKFYRRAVQHYPTFATLRGEYAVALDRDGQAANARREAAAALQLDARTPHADKKLPAELKEKLESL